MDKSYNSLMGTSCTLIENSQIFLTTHPILKEELQDNYQRVLSYSMLRVGSQIGYRNVKIFENEFIHEICTINKNQELPHLVFFHGYGATSMSAIKMFKHLYNKFQIHALDAFGLGYSSRGNFSEHFNEDQAKDYFINAVQEWRRQINIKQFVLVGHSFGGYLASCYANQYPKRIKKLVLLSPLGLGKKFEKQQTSQFTLISQVLECCFKKLYKTKILPSKWMGNSCFGNMFIHYAVAQRFKLEEEQKEDWKIYIKGLVSQQQSSQSGLYSLFPELFQPVQSITQIIMKRKFDFFIDIYFGDNDWMSRNGIQELLKLSNISLTTVPDAGHQLIFENPGFICSNIVQRFCNENQSNREYIQVQTL